MEKKKEANSGGKVSVRGAEFDRQDGKDGQKRSEEARRGGRVLVFPGDELQSRRWRNFV